MILILRINHKIKLVQDVKNACINERESCIIQDTKKDIRKDYKKIN